MIDDPALIDRVARALWIAQGGVPERFDWEWGRSEATREHWRGYAKAALEAALAPTTPDDDPRIAFLLRGVNDALARVAALEAAVRECIDRLEMVERHREGQGPLLGVTMALRMAHAALSESP